MTAAFQATLSDPLELWQPMPPETEAAVSFGLPQVAAAHPDAPVFRLCLDAHDAPPSADWKPLERALSKDIPHRFETVCQKIQACQRTSQPVSFAAAELGLEREPTHKGLREAFYHASQEAQPDPERELFSLLAEVVPSDDLHFSAEDSRNHPSANPRWQQARDDFAAFLERIDQTVLHFVWVETVLGGRLLARSAVDWSGDAVTAWDETAGPEHQRAHQQALERVARTRHLNLRLLALVLGGATRVAALLSAGTPVLALILVYRYVMDILRQMKFVKSAS